MIVTVTSTKGGSGKTTTAMHLAAGLSAHGSTILIDADKQGSAINWAGGDSVDLSFAVAVVPKLNSIKEQFGDKYDHIVIDCPPGNISVITRAMSLADHIVVTAQPTPADLDKVFEVEELAHEWQDPDTGLPSLTVLLTRVVKRTNAQLEARQVIENNALDLFEGEIYNRQGIAMSYGESLSAENIGEGYDGITDELVAMDKELRQ